VAAAPYVVFLPATSIACACVEVTRVVSYLTCLHVFGHCLGVRTKYLMIGDAAAPRTFSKGELLPSTAPLLHPSECA
jgi:hypothetical protein